MKQLSISIEWSENPILNSLAQINFSEEKLNSVPAATFKSFHQANAVFEAAARTIDYDRVEALPTRGCYDKTKMLVKYGRDKYMWRLDLYPFGVVQDIGTTEIDVLESLIQSLKNSMRFCQKTNRPISKFFPRFLAIAEEIKSLGVLG